MGWLLVPAGLLVGSAAALVSTAWTSASLPALAAVQLVICALALLIVRAREGKLDPFHPVVLIVVTFPLMYTLNIFALRSGTDKLTSTLAPWLPSQVNAQNQAAVLASVGLVLLVMGYLASTLVPARQPGSRRSTPPTRGRLLSYGGRASFVAGSGLALFAALLVATGGPKVLLANLYNRTQFLEGLNYLSEAPLLLAAVTTARLIHARSWPPSRVTILLGALTMLLTAFTGSKAPLITELLVWTIIIHWRHRAFSWRKVAAGTVVVFVLLSMYDLYFRDALPRGVSLGQVISERGGLGGAVSLLSADTFFGQQALTLAVIEFPAVHSYTGTYSIEALALAPVPRAFMPSKPVAASATFTSTFAPAFYASGSTIPATAFGEMYMSFGVYGVLVGATLFGYAIGWAYKRRDRSDGRLAIAAIVAATGVQYMRGELYGDGVLFLLLLLPTLWILRGGPARTRARVAKPPADVAGHTNFGRA